MKQKDRIIGVLLLMLPAFVFKNEGIDFVFIWKNDLWINDMRLYSFISCIFMLSIYMILYNESIFKDRSEKEILQEDFELSLKYPEPIALTITIERSIFKIVLWLLLLFLLLGHIGYSIKLFN
ncbi:MAG: hypothetical protein AB8B80_13175 [Marinicellaceae bacterium]